MIENHISISSNLCNFREWLAPLLFIKVPLETVKLFSKHFPLALSHSLSLSLSLSLSFSLSLSLSVTSDAGRRQLE